MRRKSIPKGQIKSGSFHVYFRGNHLNNVFYTELEKYHFLKLCNTYAKRYKTTINEFVLMDNHVHLQVVTENLSEFMMRFLQAYSRWYNINNNAKGKLFMSPYNCAPKYTLKAQIDSMLYILQNPVKAGICRTPQEYKWCSFNFHFNYKNELRSLIDVDTVLADNFFGHKINFETAILDNTISLFELKNSTMEDKMHQVRWMGATIADINEFIHKNIPKEFSIFSLPNSEISRLALELNRHYRCSISLISRLLHIDKRALIKLLKK